MIIDTLLALTKGETCGNAKQFETAYYCGMGIIQALKLDEIPDFTFHNNGQELLIYDGRQLIYSCNYTEYCNVKIIISAYNKDGLYYSYEIDYNSKTSKCLYDIGLLKEKYPNKWIYRLDPIYNKYGVDIVNTVREHAHLFSM
jgi:hypothetical protein